MAPARSEAERMLGGTSEIGPCAVAPLKVFIDRLGAGDESGSKFERCAASLCKPRPACCGGVTGGSVAREDWDSGSSEGGASLAGATVSRAALLAGGSAPEPAGAAPLAEPAPVVFVPEREP